MAPVFGNALEDAMAKADLLPKGLEHLENRSNLTKHRDTYSFIDPFRYKNKLRGKLVLITHAHRGIGRASAVAFAQAGASVVCVGPSAESLEALMLEIKEKYNTPTMALAANMTEPKAPAQVVQLVEKYRGPIDVLINVSPPNYVRPFSAEVDIMQDWWPFMEASLRAPVALTHAVLPSMIARKSGTIITTTLSTGVMQIPFISSEGVAKAALIKFHHHLDLENRSKGILSFAVNPGPVPSHIHDPAMSIKYDPGHLSQEPELHESMARLAAEVDWAAAGLASGTFVALCAEPRTKILSGLYVNAERDLEQLIEKMEKDRGRKVARDKLYVLKVDEY